jgi:hypothetical protein
MPDLVNSSLVQMQQAAVVRLQGLSYFAPIPIMYERQKNVRAELQKQLDTLKGLAITILTPAGRSDTPAAPGPHLSSVMLTAACTENVLLNEGPRGTRIPSSEAAEQAAVALHLLVWKPGKTLLFREIRLVPDESYLVYNVVFETSCTLAAISAGQE